MSISVPKTNTIKISGNKPINLVLLPLYDDLIAALAIPLESLQARL